GLPPTRVTDYLALVGDTSDNVPGVKGVGEKTALELLRTFGDLDAILANPERIAGKRAREAIVRDVELARLSRDLVTIRRDVPLTLDLDALQVRPPDLARLSELFTELEFRSLIPKLGSLDAVGTRPPAPAAQPVSGVALAGVAYDSMLASFVLDPGRRSHAIDELARERLSLELRTYGDVAGRGRAERPFEAVSVADAARYSCSDSDVVLRLREVFQPELEDHRLLGLLETVEVPLISVLVEMEWRGVLVDLERLADISRQFARELAELERAIYRTAGAEFNINSTPQLRHVLLEKHQLPVLKQPKTGPSTDYDVLEQLAAMGHEVPRLLIEYR